MAEVLLSIGSNSGNRKKNIRQAFAFIREYAEIIQYSKAYHTKPYGLLNQPDFINISIKIKTPLKPLGLLEKLLESETKMGRVRKQKWGERIIDLDIIFYDDLIIYDEKLIVPHYDMHNRLFVLRPLLDIAPDYTHPVFKMTIRELYENCLIKNY